MMLLQIFSELGETTLDFANFIILLGVVQGFLLSVTGFFQAYGHGKYKSLLFLSVSLILLEIFLNRAGYMYYMIGWVDFSEPVQFVIPPFLYLTIKTLDKKSHFRKEWPHLLPFLIYLILILPVFLAPRSFKTESYFHTHHLVEFAWPMDDPFMLFASRIRSIQLPLFLIQSAVYLVLSFQLLDRFFSEGRIKRFSFYRWGSFCGLFGLLILVVLLIKTFYVRDIGDHIIAWFLTGILFFSTFAELLKSPLKGAATGVREAERKSSSFMLDELRADDISNKLKAIMEKQKVFTDNLMSVNKLSKMTGEPPHVISKVLNEKIGLTFFEWIGYYRIEEAKRILADIQKRDYTIEQISEEVGYNSKSAFNKAFKKQTGKTPSEYKNSLTPVI